MPAYKYTRGWENHTLVDEILCNKLDRHKKQICKRGFKTQREADEMHIWTQEQYEQFSGAIQKSSVKPAFDMLFYTRMLSGKLLVLTSADLPPQSGSISIRSTPR